ncbi:hypothetical protein M569_16725 [Genlisea aurea]|uniref:Uncharacterized protein n=1 Tax=Genlisea aurea TaxID=192259 RepID=S8C0W3_9LAMI|nr:hypothetical protein M569_16725 [Genlisea aurea]
MCRKRAQVPLAVSFECLNLQLTWWSMPGSPTRSQELLLTAAFHVNLWWPSKMQHVPTDMSNPVGVEGVNMRRLRWLSKMTFTNGLQISKNQVPSNMSYPLVLMGFKYRCLMK